MKSVLKYGALALLPMSALMLLPSLLFGLRPEWMRASEVVGYTTMVLCMSTTVLAMRERHRTPPPSGFGGLFALGVGVTALAALGFALLSWAWFAHMGEAGVTALMQYYTEQVQAAGGPDQATRLAELEAYRPMLRNAPLQGAVMGATVFVIGVAEALLGALWLRRRPIQQLGA